MHSSKYYDAINMKPNTKQAIWKTLVVFVGLATILSLFLPFLGQ